ncbi:MAG: type restriction enzyme subunit [Acidobacteriota bacterium]|jgi:type I restriction enzyme S subunit|nr:type restriction enzyme subunit [Acidobacteriota bacterium]
MTFGELIDRGVLDVTDGYRAKNSELGGTGLIFLRAGHVTDTHIDFEGVDRFRDELTRTLTEKLSKAGDVVVTTKGNSTGRTTFVTSRMPTFVYSPHLSRWRSLAYDQLEPGFLRYWSIGREFGVQLRGMSASTDMAPYLSLRDQRRLEITLPPIEEQRAIAHVLGALDDKIEQNRRTARVLERLALAIFRAWFVDFEPVRGKAKGATSFRSMPKPVFDALPTRFVDSEIGPVPEGWEARALSVAFEVNPTRPLRKGELAPYLDMKNMPTVGHAPVSWTDRVFGSGMRFMNGDTLVARITPCLENGKTAFVDFLRDGQLAWGSTEYIVFRPIAPLPPIFAYCLARTPEFRDYAVQNMSGTSGRQRVSSTAMDHYRIAVPSGHVAAAFGEVVTPMFDHIRAGIAESRKLAEIRNYLLPRLLSGEVRMPFDTIATGSHDDYTP